MSNSHKSEYVVCRQQRLSLLCVLLYDTHKSIQNLIVETEQTGLSPTLIRCLLLLPLGVLSLFHVLLCSVLSAFISFGSLLLSNVSFKEFLVLSELYCV